MKQQANDLIVRALTGHNGHINLIALAQNDTEVHWYRVASRRHQHHQSRPHDPAEDEWRLARQQAATALHRRYSAPIAQQIIDQCDDAAAADNTTTPFPDNDER
jgi:hypothetical protein